MIVTCEQCSTSFQLDESRIPASGARVRCSRCKHAFFLANPAAAPEAAVHAVAEEAAVDPGLATPNPAEDLGGESWDGLGGAPVSIGSEPEPVAAPEPEPESEPAAAPPPAAEPELDEEDWQFSEEVRIEGEEPEDAAAGPFAGGVDGDLSSADFGDDFLEEPSDVSGELADAAEPESDFDTGLDTSTFADDVGEEATPFGAEGREIASAAAAEPEAASGLELDVPPAAPPSAEPVRDESSFGTVDDFSNLMEDEAPAASTPSDPVADLADELRAEAEASPTSTYATGGQTDDLGDPESWDLVGSDDPGARTAPLGAAAGVPAVEAEDFFDDSPSTETAAGLDLASSRLATGPIGWITRTIGWAATVVAIGFVLQLAFTAEVARWSQRSAPVSAGPLEAATLGSGWVETARSGAVLRIEGEVRNVDERSRSVGTVQLALLDATGARLDAPPVRVGLPIAEVVLREAPIDVLNRRAEIAADRFLAAPLAPGESRRFEALVPEDRLPKQAARIEIELAPATADQRGGL